MESTTVFVTYNPGNSQEQTIAARLHTIGAVSGFRMYMPDRFNSETVLDNETKRRINQSDYVVMFSMGKLSTIVKHEIETAFKHIGDKSKIIIIYDKHKGKNLKSEITNYFTPFYFDKYHNKQDELLKAVINTIFHKEKNEIINKQEGVIRKLNKEISDASAISALLGVGLGLLILGVLGSRR